MKLHLDIPLGEETYRIAVKRAANARRFTLRVRAASNDVLLTIPQRSAIADAESFAVSNAAWIGARLRRLPQPAPFRDRAIIPVLGVPHQIQHVKSSRGTVWIESQQLEDDLQENSFLLCVAGDETHLPRRVHDFLKNLAAKEIQSHVAKHAVSAGRTPARVTLRDTSSRWGSCSASGCLNFSWRLVFAPEFVVDYLTAHEVAHLVHLNHSPKFWKLTRMLCPQTDRAEAWLNAHGPSLYRYGKE